MRHGHGAYRWADGCTYEGDFEDDCRHGEAILEGVNVALLSWSGRGHYKGKDHQYEGSWKHDLMDGEVMS